MRETDAKGADVRTPEAAGAVQEICCPTCHAEQFRLIDESRGQLRCEYCRNTWIDLRFKKVSSTERFLQEQAKQPRITFDNTTETDKQLLSLFTGLLNFPSSRLATTLKIVGAVVALALVALIVWLILAPLALIGNLGG
jgi:ribosomal protein L37AE/L43A